MTERGGITFMLKRYREVGQVLKMGSGDDCIYMYKYT